MTQARIAWLPLPPTTNLYDSVKPTHGTLRDSEPCMLPRLADATACTGVQHSAHHAYMSPCCHVSQSPPYLLVWHAARTSCTAVHCQQIAGPAGAAEAGPGCALAAQPAPMQPARTLGWALPAAPSPWAAPAVPGP